MTASEITLLITAGTGLFIAVSTALGKTASYLIGIVQQQLKDTITAKNEEIKVKDARIALLEGKLRKAGIDP